MSGPPSFGEIAGLASRTLQKRRHNLRFLKYDEFDSNESALTEPERETWAVTAQRIHWLIQCQGPMMGGPSI